MTEVQASGNGNEKVLIAMDGSEHSFRAFSWYMKFIHKAGNEVLIVHCPDYKNLVRTPVMSTDPSVIAGMVKHCENEEEKLVAEIQGTLDASGVAAKILRVHGEPGAAIIKASREHHVNLIVTGSRGLGTVRRTLIGSVSNYILHHSHIPVLICQNHEHSSKK